MRKRRSCCALRFSLFRVFFFFSLTVFPSLQAVCQSQSRRCPSGQPAVIFICNYLYGVYLLKRTLLDCIRWHNRPFSAIQQFPLAQRHSRVRKRVTQDREMRERERDWRCNSKSNITQQSVDCNRYLSCFSGQLSLLFLASTASTASAAATWLAFLCNKHVVKMSIAFSGCAFLVPFCATGPMFIDRISCNYIVL